MGLLPDHIVVDDPNIAPINDALAEAFETLGIDPMGGASGRGWSNYNMLQLCPRKYQLTHIKKMKPDHESPALCVGIIFHALLAVYYVNLRALIADDPEGPPPTALRDALLEARAEGEHVAEAWRCFSAYADYYESVGDYLEPLAVEQFARDPATGNTCRYDLIATVNDLGKDRGIVPGTYIVEHKTSSRLDRATTEGWHLDGEVMGQLFLYQRAKLARKYGKLQGVIVNITLKTKTPNFHREIVAPPMRQMRAQAKDLELWAATEQLYRATGRWPRALAACYGHRFGPCHFVDVCKES